MQRLTVKRSPTKKFWWVMYNDVVLCTRDTIAEAKQEVQKLSSKYRIPVS